VSGLAATPTPKDLSAQIETLRAMSRADLIVRYREIFKEEPRTKHRDCLWRQIAWKIQADAHGGLSERAKRLAEELARDSDVRVRIPRDAFRDVGAKDPPPPAAPPPPPPPSPPPLPAVTLPAAEPRAGRDPRLPPPGTVLRREYRGTEVTVTVRDEDFLYGEKPYRTLSAVARAVTGSRWNGFLFFGLSSRTGDAA
jgi:hypothetical protein